MPRHVLRLAAAIFAVAAAGVVVPAAPGRAAACGTHAGVTVVVDFHQLGKGLAVSCDPSGGGGRASDLFTEVGHTLRYVDGESFVCEVDGAPDTQCVRTPPANAYWSLWWADGKSGDWKYASVGVGSLHVPDGGSVALSWQKGQSQAPPGIAPRAHSPSPPPSSPTSHPTSRPSSPPTRAATSSPTTTTSTAPGSPTPSASRSGTGKHTHGPTPSTSATPRHHASKDPVGQAAGPAGAVTSGAAGGGDSGAGGLPGWVAPVAVVVIFAVGGAVTVLRRKSNGGG